MIGRESELQYLKEFYQKDSSELVILYGKEGVGKTTLLREFMKDRDCYYYLARKASDIEQVNLMMDELPELDFPSVDEPDYDMLFRTILASKEDKAVIIIDEFQHLVRNGKNFMDAIIKLKNHEYTRKDVFVILVSSSICFVENNMVKRIGTAAFQISGFCKIKEFNLEETAEFLNAIDLKQGIEYFCILGGLPRLLKAFDTQLSLKENIIKNILNKDAYLFSLPQLILSEELRETAVYQALLSGLARGKNKLNDLHHYTGYSRAKISVYLGNLMELDLVEKVFSMEVGDKEETKKGLYRIKNNYLNFYYQFVFPHLSMLELISAKEFYRRYMEEALEQYFELFTSEISKEILQMLAKKRILNTQNQIGSFFGKKGNLDGIYMSDETTVLLQSKLSNKSMNVEDFEWIEFVSKVSGITFDHIYLFSLGGYTKELNSLSLMRDDLSLLQIEEL